MHQEHMVRLKKYLLFISVLGFSVLFGHICFLYLYHDAKETPIEGGTVSEGIIGKTSHLNPLLYSNDYNKNIISMLYRGLLRYDNKEQKLVSDLASCDIKDLSYIECYLKDNIFWSNGNKVTAQDVLSTYTIIKNGNINPMIAGILEKTTLEEKAGNIIFRNQIKDINFLVALMQPIVSKETLDNIGNKELNGEFNSRNGIYSGPYQVESLSSDDSLGVEKLSLVKNPFYKEKNVLISRYIYKFFKDNAHFLKHKELVNIFYDQNSIIGESIPRFSPTSFVLNRYVSFFINEEKIKDPNLRDFILSKISPEAISKVVPANTLPVSNPFMIETQTPSLQEKNNNIEFIMKNLGYTQKDEIKEKYVKELNSLTQTGASQTIENSPLEYVIAGATQKYNFIGTDNILIEGTTKGKKVDKVFVNGYELSSFKSGDENFYYRLKLEFKNLVAGQNKYVVEFQTNDKKETVEEFFITFSSDAEKLSRLEKEFFTGDKEKNEARIKELNEEIAKIDVLENKFYYNKDYKKYELTLVYLDDKEEFGLAANVIKTALQSYGIGVKIESIKTSELNTQMIENKESYDMILVGIDLGNFNPNIFPYFHSSQANGGYNFSNTKSLNLDIALEELKSQALTQERMRELQNKVITLLSERGVVKTLYTKKQTYLIDKNIKKFEFPKTFSSSLALNESILDAYISSEKTVDYSQKSIGGLFEFIKNSFTNGK